MNREMRSQVSIGGLLSFLSLMFLLVPYNKSSFEIFFLSLMTAFGLILTGRVLWVSLYKVEVDEIGIRRGFKNWTLESLHWAEVIEAELKEVASGQSRSWVLRLTYKDHNHRIHRMKISKAFLSEEKFGILMFEIEKFIPERLRRTFEPFVAPH